MTTIERVACAECGARVPQESLVAGRCGACVREWAWDVDADDRMGAARDTDRPYKCKRCGATYSERTARAARWSCGLWMDNHVCGGPLAEREGER